MSEESSQHRSDLSKDESFEVHAEKERAKSRGTATAEDEVASDPLGLDAYPAVSVAIGQSSRSKGLEFAPSFHALRKEEVLKDLKAEASGNKRLTELLDELVVAMKVRRVPLIPFTKSPSAPGSCRGAPGMRVSP